MTIPDRKRRHLTPAEAKRENRAILKVLHWFKHFPARPIAAPPRRRRAPLLPRERVRLAWPGHEHDGARGAVRSKVGAHGCHVVAFRLPEGKRWVLVHASRLKRLPAKAVQS